METSVADLLCLQTDEANMERSGAERQMEQRYADGADRAGERETDVEAKRHVGPGADKGSIQTVNFHIQSSCIPKHTKNLSILTRNSICFT